jgi:disulfide bond formation protein DsbB
VCWYERLAVEMGIENAIGIQNAITDVLRFVPFAVALILATAIAALMLASRHPHFRSGSFHLILAIRTPRGVTGA